MIGPIVLFAYDRLSHLRASVECLADNIILSGSFIGDNVTARRGVIVRRELIGFGLRATKTQHRIRQLQRI